MDTLESLRRERDEALAAAEEAQRNANKWAAMVKTLQSHNFGIAEKLFRLTGDRTEFVMELEACPCACCVEALNCLQHGRSLEGVCSCPEHFAREQCDCPYCRRNLHAKAEGYL